MRVPAVMLAAMALTSTPAAAAPSAQQVSGLRGVVLRGPTMPVCRQDVPCYEPAKDFVLRFKRDGAVRARVKTNDSGKYLVRLRPGWYRVTTPSLRPGQSFAPHVVRVPRGRIGRLTFHVDTGLQ
jgi:hypothetical protein